LESPGTTGNSGYNASTSAFVHVLLKYTADAGSHPVLDFTVGNFNRSITFASLTAFSQVEVGLRLSPANVPDAVNAGTNYLDVDNFSVGAIPEPAAMAMTALGGTGFFLRRRRTRD
jgi:hypothetical protein